MPSVRKSVHSPLYSWSPPSTPDMTTSDCDESSSSDSAGVPRPCNSFILFRRQYSKTHCKQAGGAHSDDEEKSLSRRAGNAWRALSESEKRPWILLAKKEKEDHQRRYPNYRFRPSKRTPRQGKPTLRKSGRRIHSESEVLAPKSEAKEEDPSRSLPVELVPVPKRSPSLDSFGSAHTPTISESAATHSSPAFTLNPSPTISDTQFFDWSDPHPVVPVLQPEDFSFAYNLQWSQWSTYYAPPTPICDTAFDIVWPDFMGTDETSPLFF